MGLLFPITFFVRPQIKQSKIKSQLAFIDKKILQLFIMNIFLYKYND
jgi:hypothetical protein